MYNIPFIAGFAAKGAAATGAGVAALAALAGYGIYRYREEIADGIGRAYRTTAEYVRDLFVGSAIFVDFDNIYISLKDHDEQLAEYFASEPLVWLKRLEKIIGYKPNSAQVKRCYFKPSTFQDYQQQFSSAGFEIVLCKQLTQQGKTLLTCICKCIFWMSCVIVQALRSSLSFPLMQISQPH